MTLEIFREFVETTESGSARHLLKPSQKGFRAEGFANSDVQVLGPSARKKNVIVRLPGKGPGKPILWIWGNPSPPREENSAPIVRGSVCRRPSLRFTVLIDDQ